MCVCVCIWFNDEQKIANDRGKAKYAILQHYNTKIKMPGAKKGIVKTYKNLLRKHRKIRVL